MLFRSSARDFDAHHAACSPGGCRRGKAAGRIDASSVPSCVVLTGPSYPFFPVHFASTSSCFFFGSLRCSSQRKRNRGPFDRFLQPGYRQLMSRLRLPAFLATPLPFPGLGAGSHAIYVSQPKAVAAIIAKAAESVNVAAV